MKIVSKLLYISVALLLISCEKFMSESLHYTTSDGINLKELIDSNDLQAKGSYWYNDSIVASGYIVNSKYYLLVLKLDSVSSQVKYSVEGHTPYKDVSGIYSAIIGDKMTTHYNAIEIRKSYPVKLITSQSDGTINTNVSNDSLMEFHAQFQKLVIHFNGNEKAQLYMESKQSMKNAEVAFYRKNGIFYLFFMTAKEDIKIGTLHNFLFTKDDI